MMIWRPQAPWVGATGLVLQFGTGAVEGGGSTPPRLLSGVGPGGEKSI